MEILALSNLSFSYPDSGKRALDSVSLSVERGEFIAVCGCSGSGKSTLLRLLKPQLAPLGEREGEIFYAGRNLDELSERESAEQIGFIAQRPEEQIVTDKVWHELAFALESLGMPREKMRRRAAEMAAYFGIEDWFDRDVCELSGGQKQLLNLASVMAASPQILLLDEPTSQLDPIAASEFITTLSKLKNELSLTIIIIEHRLEEIIPLADKLLVLDEGRVLQYGRTRQTAAQLRDYPALLEAMPAAVRLHAMLGSEAPCPLTVGEGRALVESCPAKYTQAQCERIPCGDENALEVRDVWLRYERNAPDVLRGLELRVKKGEIMCVLGGNGSGKSTAMRAIAGLRRAYSGSIRVFGRRLSEYRGGELYRECVAMLPQDVQSLFVCDTVAGELGDARLPGYDLTHLLNRHPYDLSGGEQQLVGIAKVLGCKPRLLLLDEPTKGIDAHTKRIICDILGELKRQDVTVLCVTHDVEFAALCADRCALFFRGEVVCCEPPEEFFSDNSFYTTAASRMTRGHYDGVVTVEQAAQLCLRNLSEVGK